MKPSLWPRMWPRSRWKGNDSGAATPRSPANPGVTVSARVIFAFPFGAMSSNYTKHHVGTPTWCLVLIMGCRERGNDLSVSRFARSTSPERGGKRATIFRGSLGSTTSPSRAARDPPPLKGEARGLRSHAAASVTITRGSLGSPFTHRRYCPQGKRRQRRAGIRRIRAGWSRFRFAE